MGIEGNAAASPGLFVEISRIVSISLRWDLPGIQTSFPHLEKFPPRKSKVERSHKLRKLKTIKMFVLPGDSTQWMVYFRFV